MQSWGSGQEVVSLRLVSPFVSYSVGTFFEGLENQETQKVELTRIFFDMFDGKFRLGSFSSINSEVSLRKSSRRFLQHLWRLKCLLWGWETNRNIASEDKLNTWAQHRLKNALHIVAGELLWSLAKVTRMRNFGGVSQADLHAVMESNQVLFCCRSQIFF